MEYGTYEARMGQSGDGAGAEREKISGLRRQKHPRSIARDAKYVRDIGKLLVLLEETNPALPLVSSRVCVDLYTSLIAPITKRPWYLEPVWLNAGSLPRLRKHNVPPTAEERTERLVSMYWHLALVETGSVYAFSLNLHDDVEKEARGHPRGPVYYLYRRLASSLQIHLKRPVDFYVGGELARGRFHLHGEIGLSELELKSARTAMRQAAGEWKAKGRNMQCDIRTADANWSGYVCGTYPTPGAKAEAVRERFERFGRERLERLGLLFRPAFHGQLLACTARLKARGVSLYKEHRSFVIEHKSMLTEDPHLHS